MSDAIKAEDLIAKIQEAAAELDSLRKPEWFIIEPHTGIPRTFQYMLENGFKIYDENGIIIDAKTNEEFEIVMIDANRIKTVDYAKDIPLPKRG